MDTSQAQIARIASHRTHEQGNPGRGSSRQGPVHSNPEGSYRVTPIHTQFPVFPKSHNFFASVSEKTDIWENCYDVGWKGDSSRYKSVRDGKRVIREHRFVAELYLGKQLLNHLGLWIHHKNLNFRENEFNNFGFVTPKEHYHIHRDVSRDTLGGRSYATM